MVELYNWGRADVFVAQMIRDTLATRQCSSLFELDREILLELHTVAEGFLEEAPTDDDPGFAMGRGPI